MVAVRAEVHAPLEYRDVRLNPDHAGRRILVTGGAGGIGKAVAETLVSQGATVVLTDVREAALEQAVSCFEADKSRVFSLAMDVSNPQSIADGVASAEEKLGAIDGLVNNAGVFRSFGTLDATWGDWEKMFAVNVFGAFETARLVAKSMIAKGVKGSIVNLASEAGKKGYSDSIAYSASKATVISFTRTLAIGLAKSDINVNCVCPCGTDTPMLREVAVSISQKGSGDSVDDVYDRLISSQFQRHIRPVEVARVISFLLSDSAVLIRGQAVNIDGGDTPY